MNKKYILVEEIPSATPTRHTVEVSVATHKRLKKHCDDESKVMIKVLSNLLRTYLEKYNK